jgi:hypothetical protein
MDEIFGATGTNLEQLPPQAGNGSSFYVKPELLTFKVSPMSEALAPALAVL